MKERRRSAKTFSNFVDFSQFPCNEHPCSSSVGICPDCLHDRLMKLVCPECGGRRVSSCNCSVIASSLYRNSCSSLDVGSVGRISFLIENDKAVDCRRRSFLRSSSSSGIGRITRLFGKRRNKGRDETLEFRDEDSERRSRDVFDYVEFERDFSAMDEKGFIELKLDSESKEDSCSEVGEIFAGFKRNGGSCRITMEERGLKQGNRSNKLWRWISKFR